MTRGILGVIRRAHVQMRSMEDTAVVNGMQGQH